MSICAPNEKILPRFLSPGERWGDLIDRVSSIGQSAQRSEYRAALLSGVLVPAGQILRGAARPGAVLHNCFVTKAEAGEPAESIGARVTEWTALGAGVGVNLDQPFAEIRRRGGSPSSILVELAKSQQRLWERGVTRTATMITLSASNPDVCSSARLLVTNPIFRHLNLGVLIEDRTMHTYVRQGGGVVRALAEIAWRTGNPGLLFTDRIAADQPFEEVVDACNPCAEQHLASDEGCALASVDLSRVCDHRGINRGELEAAVRIAVRLLDDVIDAASYPSSETEVRAKKRRRIGIGVLGFATALCKLGIPYGSTDSIDIAGQWSAAIRRVAEAESVTLATERGQYPDCNTAASALRRRNSHILSVAPTGAISLLWGRSSGIEPYFDLAIAKETLDVTFEVNPKRPPELAVDVSPMAHVDLTAAWQRFVDGGISKTVNLFSGTRIEDVERVFVHAWRQGCKGISIFRTGSREPAVRKQIR
jgi:ribonucleoside-diphosphate reductase alpha chain